MSNLLNFIDKVAVITGAGRGLGREYAMLLASRGASVVVNDLCANDHSSSDATKLVKQIEHSGGKAIADHNSVEDGQKIVQTAIDKFGRIDILINNAGILRDKSILKMTDDDWDQIYRVHLRGSFVTTRAAWTHFRDQSYGRVIMTSSPSGIYGNFGQANYSAAKLGLLSLARTLAIEGEKYNIKCNTIVPVAATRMTEDIFPDEMKDRFNPKYVAPMVGYLCHETCPVNGEAFEAAAGYFGQYRWQRSKGKVFEKPEQVSIEDIDKSWNELTDWKESTNPNSMQDHMMTLFDQIATNDN
ncbi:hypothetical protein RDWZM_004686 [Blomia tropicalis]|uniref:Ketoreductase domain-containing protein n=1 Tax=Blomia tropicalis TaxID=40697 RepID=A0A9Q0RLL3_BLOTA|nr:hypothetical protein RDWZM_004686 [Blomia tropicalis]